MPILRDQVSFIIRYFTFVASHTACISTFMWVSLMTLDFRIQWKPSVTLVSGTSQHACPPWILVFMSCSVVLATIQDKVNNPSPDDPFEPEIAAVRISGVINTFICLLHGIRVLATQR